MTERKLTLKDVCLYPVYEDGKVTDEWQVLGYAPKGGLVRILVGEFDLSKLREIRRYVDRAIVREIERMRATIGKTLDEAASGWRTMKAASSGDTPGGAS